MLCSNNSNCNSRKISILYFLQFGYPDTYNSNQTFLFYQRSSKHSAVLEFAFLYLPLSLPYFLSLLPPFLHSSLCPFLHPSAHLSLLHLSPSLSLFFSSFSGLLRKNSQHWRCSLDWTDFHIVAQAGLKLMSVFLSIQSLAEIVDMSHQVQLDSERAFERAHT